MNDRMPQLNFEAKGKGMAVAVEKIRGLQERCYVHGHGTRSAETAISIMERGLYTEHGILGEFTHTLPTDQERIENELSFWNYDNRKAVVLIAVPKHPDYYNIFVAADGRDAAENERISKSYAAQHVFKIGTPTPDMKASPSADKYIPPELIVGFWDTEKKIWHPNPRFSEIAQSPLSN